LTAAAWNTAAYENYDILRLSFYQWYFLLMVLDREVVSCIKPKIALVWQENVIGGSKLVLGCEISPKECIGKMESNWKT
jgi:hypothetical protein